MAWYGQAAGNPLSGSATHDGQQFPANYGVDHQSAREHSYAIAATPLQIYKPPSYVVINNAGGFGFAYALTGSIGATLTKAEHGHLFITGSIIVGDNKTVRLDIQPSAWAGTSTSDEVVGDVTFVYKGSK